MILCPMTPIAARPRVALPRARPAGLTILRANRRIRRNMCRSSPGELRSNIPDVLVVSDICGHERDVGYDLTLRMGSVIVKAIGVVAVLVQLS